jgi:cytidine deaminase
MLTVCAERVALLKALSQGATSFTAIAIVASDGRSCPPCGVCRQMLAEFAPGISVFLGADDGIRRYEIGDLLPYPFERP